MEKNLTTYLKHPKHNFENSELTLVQRKLTSFSIRIRNLLEPSSGIKWDDRVFNCVSQFTQNINEYWDSPPINRNMANAIRYSNLKSSTLAEVMSKAGIGATEFTAVLHMSKSGKKHEVYK